MALCIAIGTKILIRLSVIHEVRIVVVLHLLHHLASLFFDCFNVKLRDNIWRWHGFGSFGLIKVFGFHNFLISSSGNGKLHGSGVG
jgi:hypothetical protein